MTTNKEHFRQFAESLYASAPGHHVHTFKGYIHIDTAPCCTADEAKQLAGTAAGRALGEAAGDASYVVTSPLQHRLWFLSAEGAILMGEYATIEIAVAARDGVCLQTVLTGPPAAPLPSVQCKAV